MRSQTVNESCVVKRRKKHTNLVNSVADYDGIPLADLLVTRLASLTRVTHLGGSWLTDDVQNKILTTSAGFWHMMVSWVTSWVRKLYWQYSSCLEQSSVTFFTRTTSTFLKQEVRLLVNHWLIFREIGQLYLSTHLQPTTVVLVHCFEISTFVDDLINVQLISFNHMFIEYFVNVQFNWNLRVWDS